MHLNGLAWVGGGWGAGLLLLNESHTLGRFVGGALVAVVGSGAEQKCEHVFEPLLTPVMTVSWDSRSLAKPGAGGGVFVGTGQEAGHREAIPRGLKAAALPRAEVPLARGWRRHVLGHSERGWRG